MSLREVEPPAGPPWGKPLVGALDELVVESELLAGNPLGDPARRPLYVYRPPGVEAGQAARLPSVYVIQGYYGRVDAWLRREPFEPSMVERVDDLFERGDCPDAIVVFVDAWTAYGGSQYVDSIATGPYQSYLCDEVVPFVDERYPTAAERERRGISGKSSGGYGAMVVPMMRPDCFSALASHAGDALFELCHIPFFGEPPPARSAITSTRRSTSSSRSSPTSSTSTSSARRPADGVRVRRRLHARSRAAGQGAAAHSRSRRAAWSTTSGSAGWSGIRSGWRALAPRPCARMRYIYLDGGRSDEWYLDLGRPGLRPRARQARRRARAGALRGQARRHRLPLSRSDPADGGGAQQLSPRPVGAGVTGRRGRAGIGGLSCSGVGYRRQSRTLRKSGGLGPQPPDGCLSFID